MATRGRQSAASLAIARIDERLSPPADLTEAQRNIWVQVVNSRPADWFGIEHTGLLTQYCRHKVQADLLAAELEGFDPGWLKDTEGLRRYDKLSAMMDRESKAITMLLRSMRLTQQSLIRADKAVKSTRTRKPWETD